MISKFHAVEMVSKPLLTGLVAGIATRYVTYGSNEFGQAFTIGVNTMVPILSKFNGSRINLAVMTAVSVGLASFTTDLIGDKLFAFIAKDEVMQNAGSGLFQLASVSAGTGFTHYIVNNNSLGERGVLNIIGIAVASEAISTYVYNCYIRPRLRDSEEEYNF
jgi:hypothetical protein|tara:strand:- start:245 stop:730 length:486 start_codon:yes stop_codon:yes gene_type:complete